MVTLCLIKEARIYNGEKTASSISGAGKTGQLHLAPFLNVSIPWEFCPDSFHNPGAGFFPELQPRITNYLLGIST